MNFRTFAAAHALIKEATRRKFITERDHKALVTILGTQLHNDAQAEIRAAREFARIIKEPSSASREGL